MVKIMKIIFMLMLLSVSTCFAQRQEATITRTFGTNSVYPRQFPSMTVRKMNDNEYWLYDSLSTNTIFHRIFPTYIVRKQNTYTSSQGWGVYRTTSTNSVFPTQFPDRYISNLDWNSEKGNNIDDKRNDRDIIKPKFDPDNLKFKSDSNLNQSSSYTYSKSLRSDKKSSYCAESPE